MIEEIKAAIALAEKGRGTAKDLINASPVQIDIYNAFTGCKRQLEMLLAVVEDAQGIYMKGKKGK